MYNEYVKTSIHAFQIKKKNVLILYFDAKVGTTYSFKEKTSINIKINQCSYLSIVLGFKHGTLYI